MKRRLWSVKWFILACIWTVFFFATGTRVALAGTDSQLQVILGNAIQFATAYFNFLLDVLQKVW